MAFKGSRDKIYQGNNSPDTTGESLTETLLSTCDALILILITPEAEAMITEQI